MNFDKNNKVEADTEEQDELRPEYGETELRDLLTSGIRGKYVERYCQCTNRESGTDDVNGLSVPRPMRATRKVNPHLKGQ